MAGALPGWVFRGQGDDAWPLRPSVERACLSLPTVPWADAERRALDLFRTCPEDLLPNRPEDDDHLGWLALLQHYGGPTRLLDFTYSVDVAAYFALEDPTRQRSAVWAVNELILAGVLKEELAQPLPEQVDIQGLPHRWWLFNRWFVARITGFAALVVTPAWTDTRQRAQQAAFLAALNPRHTLAENLFGMFALEPGVMERNANMGYFTDPRAEQVLHRLQRSPVVKIVLQIEDRLTALKNLAARGVDRASLFPGLDGFGASLRHRSVWDVSAGADDP